MLEIFVDSPPFGFAYSLKLPNYMEVMNLKLEIEHYRENIRATVKERSLGFL